MEREGCQCSRVPAKHRETVAWEGTGRDGDSEQSDRDVAKHSVGLTNAKTSEGRPCLHKVGASYTELDIWFRNTLCLWGNR